jgi:hypothetical protein
VGRAHLTCTRSLLIKYVIKRGLCHPQHNIFQLLQNLMLWNSVEANDPVVVCPHRVPRVEIDFHWHGVRSEVNMATETFPLFSSLPLELRRKIYMLATPPRIVPVQEVSENHEEFEERFRTTPVQLKLDPSLTHFAFNWRRIPHIHRHSRQGQQTLDSYGITGGKASHRPWEPSASTPKIPLCWLANQPKVAWELVRQGYLYSKAPIPALLHTCSESRAELMNCGYQLSFRTRSNEPRTWFNFERDVLYIDLHWNHFEGEWRLGLLSGCLWDIGQFHPEDLKRARKLALNGSAHLLAIQNPDSASTIESIHQLSGALRLFSGLTELLLVEWSQEDVGQWSEFSAKKSVFYSRRRHGTEQHTVDMPRELLSCVVVEEIDALLSLITAQEKCRTELSSAGNTTEMLKAHKQQTGGTASYFQYRQLQLEQLLLEHRDATVSGSNKQENDGTDLCFGCWQMQPEELLSLERRDATVSGSNDESVAPWEIPRIKAVHVLPSSMASFLSHERQIAWVEFSEMKRRQPEVTTSASTVPPAPMIPSPGPCCGQCSYGYYLDQFVEGQKKWWVQAGTVQVPGDEIIY